MTELANHDDDATWLHEHFGSSLEMKKGKEITALLGMQQEKPRVTQSSLL